MEKKFIKAHFGKCLRLNCQYQNMLPLGLSDDLGQSSVKLYCPKCRELYQPKSSKYKSLDGAFWGTSFPHLFLINFPQYIPEFSKNEYVPKIYGFKVNENVLNPSFYEKEDEEDEN
jgi:casein kinase II subunit beta